MPGNATSNLKDLARRLLAGEAPARQASANESAILRLEDKLRQPLGQLLGSAGFRALISRALALAGEEVPWLRALHIKADGSVEGLAELEVNLDDDAIAAGEIVLLARLLELLITFIGPAVTLHVIQHASPKVSLDDFDLEQGQGP